jgi:hypothetical protein
MGGGPSAAFPGAPGCDSARIAHDWAPLHSVSPRVEVTRDLP